MCVNRNPKWPRDVQCWDELKVEVDMEDLTNV